jgi:DME family drug/metabolite transporter
VPVAWRPRSSPPTSDGKCVTGIAGAVGPDLAASTPATRTEPGHSPYVILVAATLWGTTGTAATLAPRGTSSIATGSAAMGIGGLLLLAVTWRGSLALVRRRDGRRAVLLGAACIAVYPLAFYTSMARAGVAVGVTLTIGSSPVAAALIERCALRRHLSGRWVITTALAVCGAVLLGSSQAQVGHFRPVVVGALLAVVAGCCYAGYSVAASRLVQGGVAPGAAMGTLFGLAAAFLVPVFALSGAGLLSSGRGVLVIGYLAAIPMAAGYALFGRGLRHASASTATALSLAEPVVAALVADGVAHQPLTILGWVGVAIVAASVTVLPA